MSKRQEAKKETQDYAEFLEQAWKTFRSHEEDYDGNVPPSNYPFAVGESVRVGNLHDPRVEEVLLDGRLLHLSIHDRGEKYGKPWDNQRRLPILRWWIGVEPIVTEEPTAFGRERIHATYTQTSLDALIHQAYWRGLLDSPDYQRDYVWTLADKQRLVRSILNRMDIGKFVFLARPYPENRLEVVDGKQRLNAILEFTQGRFPFEGKTWFQFSQGDKNVFEDLMVQVATLDSEHVSKADILQLFLSINTGGVPQTEEHVAKARKLYEEEVRKMESEER